MASDRARISFDATRAYHAVVKQQGRVTLEADDNEAAAIAVEASRVSLIDVVGPCGTPDDGYAISGGLAPFDFNIGKGTMYVGGMRVALPAAIRYSTQTDWIDHTGDAMWIAPNQPAAQPQELVYLYLSEQEVSAVEDTPLREVALGGPDTAQRLRLLQRVVRFGTAARDCEAALAAAKAQWSAQGLEFRPATMRLESKARLKADFEDPGGAADPCEPDAHGGYLGADNQLIRVQVTAPGKLVWGFDNASFLYRVKVIDSRTLELQSTPCDAYHFPRAGQAVEVLRTAATLGHDDAVASATGVVQSLNAPYNPDTQQITLPTALPAIYLNASETPVVFLRIWEKEETFTAGTARSLGATGLRVTLTGGAPFPVGDHWSIAVRPSVTGEVYPRRYLDAPQPPDGPRLWACPLAVIDFAGGAFHLLDDCREPFDNLVELTRRTCEGCCTVSVGDGVISKGDFDDIQEAIEKVKSMDMPGRVCILPGEYSLKDVVAIKDAKDLIVSGCGGQCVILAQGDDPAFAIANSNGVTLEWLTVVSKSTLGTIAVLGSEDVHILNCHVINGVKNEEGWEVFPALNVASEGDRASERFELADCVLRGLPAVTVQVDGARLSRNRLSGGGIWLREGTADVVARLNEIGEGAGPGILLGGLIPGEKPAGRLAGLARIDISANRIGTMAASGITTAGGKLDHEGSSKGFSLIDDLNIEGNEIEDCAWSESAIMFEEEAIGGVVLRNVAGLRIHANRIAGNGAGGKLPACGVYLDACYGNEVTDNTILDNGPEDTESDEKLFQGGIIGRMLVAGSVRAEKNGKLGLVAGAGAAFVHDNIVVSPRGQALLLGALGPVSVAGNTLTSLEVAEQPLPAAVAEAARFGRCVFILNLGQAREMKGALSHYIKATDHFDLAAGGSGLNLKGAKAQVKSPDGRVLVQGNQISLQTARDFGDSVLFNGCMGLASMDDISLIGNQVQVEAPEGIGIDTGAAAATVRASGNRFSEIPGTTLFSLFSWGSRNSAIGNQATHCILALGADVKDEFNQVIYTVLCDIFKGKLAIEKE